MEHGPTCHPKGIRGYGNKASQVVLLGIAPGQDEVHTGRPFTGRSGQLLDAILEGVGWSRDNVYCTNLICWYKDDPTPAEINECFPRLDAELRSLSPKLVVLLGKLATEKFLGTRPRLRGAVLWSDTYNCWMMSTYHPAAVFRQLPLVHDIIRDLQKIDRILHLQPNAAHVNYTVLRDHKEAQSVLNHLVSGQEYSIDIETTNADVDSIDVFVDRLLCLSISNGHMTWVFPEAIAQGLAWPEGPRWVYHNGMFDTQGLMRYLNVRLPIHEDTLLMSYTIDERGGIHSLKSLAREYCAAGFYEEEVRQDRAKGRLDLVPTEKLYEYNAKDAAYTARLATVLRGMQKADNVEAPYKQLLIPAANAFRDIQYRGAYVCPKQLGRLAHRWGQKWLDEQVGLQEDAERYGGPPNINLNSPKQLSAFLFGHLHLPGGPSTKEEVLETLKGMHPFVNRLMEFRHLDHMLTTYVMGIDDDIKRDGRLHADVLLHGTRTGRTSYRHPPLQTIPQASMSGDEYGQARRIFAATNDDYVIGEADYGKAEVWMAYAYSGDENMYRDLTSRDFHTQVATSVFNVPYEEVTKRQRHLTKFVTFGIMYGRGAPSLAQNELECSNAEAAEYIRRWFGRYPKYSQWWNDTRRLAQEEGELVSMTGRKRRFRLVMGEEAFKALNQAVNFPIQSTASDCKLAAVIKLHEALKPFDSYILFEVHDSIIFEINKRHLDTVLQLINTIMPGPHFPNVPAIPVEIKVGPTWGTAKEVQVATIAA